MGGGSDNEGIGGCISLGCGGAVHFSYTTGIMTVKSQVGMILKLKGVVSNPLTLLPIEIYYASKTTVLSVKIINFV